MELRELMQPVSALSGVKGAALLTPDGVLIASEFSGVDGEALAALASQFLQQVQTGAEPIGFRGFRRVTLRALGGTLYFLRLEELVLLVAGERGEEPRGLWHEIERTVSSLPRLSAVKTESEI